MDNAASSSAQMLTSEFVMTLDNSLNNQIARFTASIAQYTTRIHTIEQITLPNQLKLVNDLQEKKRDCQRNVKSLENNLHSFEQCNKTHTDHVSLLKRNLEAYGKESVDMAKGYEETLTNYNNTWKDYEMKYEKFPLAIAKKNAELELRSNTIRLKIQEYKLSETKLIIKQRKRIREKRFFNLFTRCAQYWKDCELLKQQLRIAMDMQRDRHQELRAKERTLQQLITEKEQRLAEAAANQESQSAVDSIVWDLQHLRLPEMTLTIDKPALVKLPVCKDISDTCSINSTSLDELVGPIESSPKETTASQACQIFQGVEEEDAATRAMTTERTEGGNDTNSDTGVGQAADNGARMVSRKRPSTDEPESMPKLVKKTLASESRTELKRQDNDAQMEERDTIIEPSGVGSPIEMEATTENSNKEQRSEQSDVEKLSAMQPAEKDQISGPVIKSVDAVQLDLLPATIPNEEPSHFQFVHSEYFSPANVIRDNDTTRKYVADLFPIPESSREGGSIVGSEVSDDMIKQYCVTFSPEANRGGDRKCVTPEMEDHQIQPPNPIADNNGAETALGMSFGSFDVFGSSIGSRPKPDVNFLNMF